MFTANGLWFPNADKETSATFTVSSQHPLISFATMFGPSPDWLAGVSKLSLCRSDCTWIDTIVQDLFPIDAGTDSGTSYNVILTRNSFNQVLNCMITFESSLRTSHQFHKRRYIEF